MKIMPSFPSCKEKKWHSAWDCLCHWAFSCLAHIYSLLHR